jgi:GxxExxY protein
MQDEKYPHQDLTRQIIAAAYEVHRDLGYGFLEIVYENALVLELTSRGLHVVSQQPINVEYKGQSVGSYFADLLVHDAVLCELNAVEALNSAHQAQLLHYLKATGIKVGLLLNFGPKRVDVKRMVF